MLEQIHLTCPIYCCFVVFIFGLIFGSFLNVVILRSFSGESIILPPSKCPFCKKKLKWFHNIPLFSYFLLKGKCAFCGEKISIQYPTIEFFTATGFLLSYLFFGYSLQMILSWGFLFFSLAIIVTDLKEQVIFVTHTYFLGALGVLYHLLLAQEFSLKTELLDSILGIILGFIIIELISKITERLLRHRAFGNGDSYILGAFGAIVGYKAILHVLTIAIIIQAIFAFPKLLAQLFKTKHYTTITTTAIFISVTISLKIFENLLQNHSIIHHSLLFLMFASGMLLSYQFLKDIRNGTRLTALPFGPALVLAGWIVFFFQNRFIEPFWKTLMP